MSTRHNILLHLRTITGAKVGGRKERKQRKICFPEIPSVRHSDTSLSHAQC